MSETSKRTSKIALAAELLQQLAPNEIRPVAAYLAGATRQGKTGVGYATIRDATGSPVDTPSITVLELDHTLGRLSSARGTRDKQAVLRALMDRATEPEQRFVAALLVGELRQGALEGLMIDALAKAAALPAERVRRAVMMAGDFGEVAVGALTEGETALSRYDVHLFRPIRQGGLLIETTPDAVVGFAAMVLSVGVQQVAVLLFDPVASFREFLNK